MTDKEFKRLSKGELIEIIYQMKVTETQLRAALEEANVKLEDRRLKLENAGSIAEAVVRLNGIFETAQKTADEYLEQIYSAFPAAEQPVVPVAEQPATPKTEE